MSFHKNWAEVLFFSLLVIGFVVSLLAGSAVISYLIIFLIGMMAGRLMFERKGKLKFAYYLIIIGFLIGYILGAFYGSRNIMIILFVLGGLLSYYL
ncbi:MAG: hypothetical protein KJ601_06770, partial [Nanoarchaeota archaeon]|nr:hypothetical protein [Nanoarchaeota archaeon]